MTPQTLDRVFESLVEVLKENGNSSLTSAAAATVDDVMAPALDETASAKELGERLRASGHVAAQASDHSTLSTYVSAVTLAAAGDTDSAHEAFVQLTDALERAEAWDAFVHAASRALEMLGEGDFARCLARAWEKGGPDRVTAERLVGALEAAPDDHRLMWAAGFALDRAGRTEEGRRHIAASLPGFVQKNDLSRVEEGFLHLLGAKDPGIAESLLDTLILLTRQDGGEIAYPFWELAADFLESNGLHEQTWRFFRTYLSKHAEFDQLRPLAFRSFKSVAAAAGLSEESLQSTGLASSARPLREAILRTRLLMAWPPGQYVDHRYNGIGRVVSNNCDVLEIDFPGGRKEMSLDIAERSFLKLDPQDVKVRLVYDRGGLERQATEDPASLVHAALVGNKGKGSLNEIKRLLIPVAVAPEHWSGFWKKAQKAMKEDPRFDMSQSVRKMYRIVDPSDGPVRRIPEFDPRIPLSRRVDTLEKFVEENEGLASEVSALHAASLQRLRSKEAPDAPGRLAVSLLLLRLGAIDDSTARTDCAAYFAEAEEFPSAVAKGAQARCLALATGMHDPTNVYAAALASRTKAMREEALGFLAAHRAEGYLDYVLGMLRKSPQRTPAILFLVTQPELVKGWPAWDALLALVRIIAAPQRETHQKQALKELSSNKALRQGLAECDARPETWETLRLELVAWRASERQLLPILEMLDEVGRGELAEDVRSSRRGQEKPRREASTKLASFVGRILMSRASYERLGAEVTRIGMELKTTIPETIEIARAHGDLKENAEYHAAKEKQKRFATRLTELEGKYNAALVIDSTVLEEGVVGPGNVVTIENLETAERETYWLLGEGDDHLGESVISYLAPIGKAIAGRRVGEKAVVVAGGRERTFRVISIVPKIPE